MPSKNLPMWNYFNEQNSPPLEIEERDSPIPIYK